MVLTLLFTPLTSCDSDNPFAQGSAAQAADAGVDPASVTAEALRAAVENEQVQRFYEAGNWQAVWDQPKADALLEALSQTEAHGLTQDMFLTAAASDPAGREAQLTKAALDYARSLAQGRADPKDLREIYTVARPEVDVAAGLRRALETAQIGQWLASLAPQTPEYRALASAYLEHRKLAAREGEAGIAAGEPIKPGEVDPRVPRLAQALRANGYLQAPAEEAAAAPQQQPQRYTQEMATAVKRMQDDYGIASDGIVGPDTLQVLNTGAADRARQLAVNLERLRWLDRTPPPTRIDVNTAAAVLDYTRDGKHVDRRRVVVGQPDWETPQLGSPIYQLVANPNWTVPKSIEEDELADEGPAYFAENNMVRRDGWIVQLPGPENALGLVKLDMKNEHAIYLHDTPAKSLFAENERHRSHGCVRVQNAVQFAHMLADHDGILPKFEEAMAKQEETFVPLKQEVPVRLLYHTAFFDGSRVQFRTDAYGWDEDVARSLGLKVGRKRVVRPHERGDFGP